jgi:hypothetical protein
MTKYLAEVHKMEKFFDGFELRYISRLDNCNVNHLVWIASSRAPTLPNVIIEKLTKRSVRSAEEAIDAAKPEMMVIDEPQQGLAYDWISSIKVLLDNQPPLDDNAEVERITRKSKIYHLIDGILYRRGANDIMMKCISREEGDIHSGVYKSHSSWRSIIGKAFTHSFYWPTTKDDAMEVITKCKDY